MAARCSVGEKKVLSVRTDARATCSPRSPLPRRKLVIRSARLSAFMSRRKSILTPRGMKSVVVRAEPLPRIVLVPRFRKVVARSFKLTGVSYLMIIVTPSMCPQLCLRAFNRFEFTANVIPACETQHGQKSSTHKSRWIARFPWSCISDDPARSSDWYSCGVTL